MFHPTRISIAFLALVLILTVLVSCNAPEEAAVPATDSHALPAGLFSHITDEAISLVAARASAAPGQEITISGVIGGHPDPFSAERAVFIMADESVEICGDHCPTPWDACCEPPDELTAKTATIQVVGEDGRPLRIGLMDEGGLALTAHVTVQGTIAQSDGSVLVINANRINVTVPET